MVDAFVPHHILNKYADWLDPNAPKYMYSFPPGWMEYLDAFLTQVRELVNNIPPHKDISIELQQTKTKFCMPIVCLLVKCDSLQVGTNSLQDRTLLWEKVKAARELFYKICDITCPHCGGPRKAAGHHAGLVKLCETCYEEQRQLLESAKDPSKPKVKI